MGNKSNQRWIWYAVDPSTNIILAYVFGKRKDVVFKELKTLLEPLTIKRFFTDDWGAYERHIEPSKHEVGKANTQKIERKNLNLRIWIKWLTRKIICFSKSEKMYDIVIGLLINKVEFGSYLATNSTHYPLWLCRTYMPEKDYEVGKANRHYYTTKSFTINDL